MLKRGGHWDNSYDYEMAGMIRPRIIVTAKKANSKTVRQVVNDETTNLDAYEDLGTCGIQWQKELGQRTDSVPELEAVLRQRMRQ